MERSEIQGGIETTFSGKDGVTFHQDAMKRWLSAVQAAEVVVAPAEGVYGYCCDPFSDKALQNLMDLKHRSPSKGVIVLIHDVSQLAEICGQLGVAEYEAMQQFWAARQPPTTLILPAKAGLPDLVTGGRESIAVRLSYADYMREYLKAWGKPLVSSSLNISGGVPANTANAIPLDVASLILPVPLNGTPSRIWHCRTRQWQR